jgi:hypothetical protein
MILQEYQQHVIRLDIHPEEGKLWAHKLGLVEEVGEFFGKLCKAHRKGGEPDRAGLLLELGDVCWRVVACVHASGETKVHWEEPDGLRDEERPLCEYLAAEAIDIMNSEGRDIVFHAGEILDTIDALAEREGATFGEVLQMNVDKLDGRLERGTIIGAGDHR